MIIESGSDNTGMQVRLLGCDNECMRLNLCYIRMYERKHANLFPEAVVKLMGRLSKEI